MYAEHEMAGGIAQSHPATMTLGRAAQNTAPRQSLSEAILTRLDRASNLAAEIGASTRATRDRLFGPEPESCDTLRGDKVATNSAESAILDRLESLLGSLQSTAITADRLNSRL